MQVALVKPGRRVVSGHTVGRFLRMCGSDALVELVDGRRVMWSGATEVDTLTDAEEVVTNVLPKLEAELARLLSFTEGKWAPLGVVTTTPCTELPKQLHAVFVVAALGPQPEGAIVCRRCATKLCIRADHLFWGTRSDCQRDMVLRGVSRPYGKQVTGATIATAVLRLRSRITKVKDNLGKSL